MAGCVVILRQQVLTIASDLGGLKPCNFHLGWNLVGELFIVALDFQNNLAILDTLYLCLRHFERGPITRQAGASQSLEMRTN